MININSEVKIKETSTKKEIICAVFWNGHNLGDLVPRITAISLITIDVVYLFLLILNSPPTIKTSNILFLNFIFLSNLYLLIPLNRNLTMINATRDKLYLTMSKFLPAIYLAKSIRDMM